jgi:hypothetical protein
MSLAYVSRRCEDCTSFVRLASGRIRLVYVEDAPEIPWYIESVPTVVLETLGDDGRPAYDLYSGDDAFALLEPRQKPKRDSEEPSAHSGPSAHPGPPGQKAHSSQSGPSDRSDHSELSGPCAIGGNDGAVFECVGSEDGMSCGAFEALVPLGTDDDRRRTESTMAEWERAVAEERARSEKKETSKLERDFEQMKKERGN